MAEVNLTAPVGEQSQQVADNNVGSANAPGAGERVPFMERPQWVPEKFYKDGHVNMKALAESYGELEKSRGQQPPTQTGDQKQEQQVPVSEQKAGEQATKPDAISIPGVPQESLQKFTGEVTKDGKLSEGSYGELAKLGYPKAVVDAYVRGLTADSEIAGREAANKATAEIISSIGGEAVLTDMIDWAGVNLSPADLTVYNEAVSSGDAAKVRMAVQGLHHAYSKSEGIEPRQLNGGRSNSGVEPFKSNEEVVRAMSDRRYERDPAYRAEVERRLTVSSVFAQSVDTGMAKDPDKRLYRYQS